MHHTPLLTTLAAGFVLAFLFGALANRLRISPLVGYLLAGVSWPGRSLPAMSPTRRCRRKSPNSA